MAGVIRTQEWERWRGICKLGWVMTFSGMAIKRRLDSRAPNGVPSSERMGTGEACDVIYTYISSPLRPVSSLSRPLPPLERSLFAEFSKHLLRWKTSHATPPHRWDASPPDTSIDFGGDGTTHPPLMMHFDGAGCAAILACCECWQERSSMRRDI